MAPRPIYVVGGEPLETGTDLPKPRGAWTAVQGSPDGSDGRRSTVSVDDVVRHNLDALRTRIEVSRTT